MPRRPSLLSLHPILRQPQQRTELFAGRGSDDSRVPVLARYYPLSMMTGGEAIHPVVIEIELQAALSDNSRVTG
jgi:hypothetical protein